MGDECEEWGDEWWGICMGMKIEVMSDGMGSRG